MLSPCRRYGSLTYDATLSKPRLRYAQLYTGPGVRSKAESVRMVSCLEVLSHERSRQEGQYEQQKRHQGEPAASADRVPATRARRDDAIRLRQGSPPTATSRAMPSPGRRQPRTAAVRPVPRRLNTITESRVIRLCAWGATAYTMCPPSSCPPGIRFRAVANMPTQAAIAIGCKLSRAEWDAMCQRMDEPVHQVKYQGKSNLVTALDAEKPTGRDSSSPINKKWYGSYEASDRAGDADVEQRLTRADGRLDANERADRADQRGRWNEVRQRRVDAVSSRTARSVPTHAPSESTSASSEKGMPISSREGLCQIHSG